MARLPRDGGDDDLRRGARQAGDVVVLREPVARVAEAIRQPGQVDRVSQCLPGIRTGGNGRKVKNGKRNGHRGKNLHGDYGVRRMSVASLTPHMRRWEIMSTPRRSLMRSHP